MVVELGPHALSKNRPTEVFAACRSFGMHAVGAQAPDRPLAPRTPARLSRRRHRFNPVGVPVWGVVAGERLNGIQRPGFDSHLHHHRGWSSLVVVELITRRLSVQSAPQPFGSVAHLSTAHTRVVLVQSVAYTTCPTSSVG